jgi:DNA gyrase subunit B
MSQNSGQIPILDKRQHVRMRPSMYFGGTHNAATHNLIYEILENSVNQVLKERCDRIELTLYDAGGVSITDNGVGIPVDRVETTGLSILEINATGDGAQFYVVARQRLETRLNGVGIAAVNAVSSEMTIQVKRDGYLWQIGFKEGITQTPLVQVRALTEDEGTGTSIFFKPDFSIFERGEFDHQVLFGRLREIAYLLPKVTVVFDDRRSSYKLRQEFYAPNGLTDFVTFLNRDFEPLHEPIVFKETVEIQRNYPPAEHKAVIDFAIQFSSSPDTLTLGYLNGGAQLVEWGIHTESLLNALVAEITPLAQKLGYIKNLEFIGRNDTTRGLTAVISVMLPHPSLDLLAYQVSVLINPELHGLIAKAVQQAFEQFAAEQPDAMKRIIEHCLENKRRNEQRRYGK